MRKILSGLHELIRAVLHADALTDWSRRSAPGGAQNLRVGLGRENPAQARDLGRATSRQKIQRIVAILLRKLAVDEPHKS
jgi:hypothetical protein